MKKDKENEIKIIEKILSFEDQYFSECKSLLLSSQKIMQPLGIEIRVELSQDRGLYGARIKPYNLREQLKLPRFYSSKIMCYAYKDGSLLTKQEDYHKRVTSLYVMIFPLIRAWKKGAGLEFTQTPLANFDTQINGLSERILKDFKK